MGDTSVIANLVDIDTVTHFRPADHTSGGAAAPLMPYLDYILFRDKPGYTMTLNIGGIANLHVANADRRRMFDLIQAQEILFQIICVKYYLAWNMTKTVQLQHPVKWMTV